MARPSCESRMTAFLPRLFHCGGTAVQIDHCRQHYCPRLKISKGYMYATDKRKERPRRATRRPTGEARVEPIRPPRAVHACVDERACIERTVPYASCACAKGGYGRGMHYART